MGATWFEEPLIKLQGMQEDWLHIVSAVGGRNPWKQLLSA